MIHVTDVNMTNPANIRYLEILIGSGRPRSHQIVRTSHGVLISTMGMCTTTARTTSASSSAVCVDVTA